jgi:dTDP-glucose 4,6-dehydratase
MRLFVTGGAGFIGANFAFRAIERGHSVIIYDALTYAGHLDYLRGLPEDKHWFYQGDIADREALRSTLSSEKRIDAIVNFAAETHVDRSIENSTDFIRTNVLGTATLLEAARDLGIPRYVQISTDEVYGSVDAPLRATSAYPLIPSNPYAASKTGADHLVQAFHRTHGMDTRITRCTNNFGRFQHREKLIPTVIDCALKMEPIPIYGDGKFVRDWIYVDDHCNGILDVIEKGTAGMVYHFGGREEVDNLTIVQQILEVVSKLTAKPLDALQRLVAHVDDRPGHDRRYALDWTETERALGWQPRISFNTALERTVQWYIDKRSS